MKTELQLAEALSRFQTHRSAQLTRGIVDLGTRAVEGFVGPKFEPTSTFRGPGLVTPKTR